MLQLTSNPLSVPQERSARMRSRAPLVCLALSQRPSRTRSHSWRGAIREARLLQHGRAVGPREHAGADDDGRALGRLQALQHGPALEQAGERGGALAQVLHRVAQVGGLADDRDGRALQPRLADPAARPAGQPRPALPATAARRPAAP